MRLYSARSGAQQVGEDAIGSGDELGELTVERVRDVDVGSFALVGDEEAATLRVLAGVGGFSEGCVAGIPGVDESVAAFLDPVVEVC